MGWNHSQLAERGSEGDRERDRNKKPIIPSWSWWPQAESLLWTIYHCKIVIIKTNHMNQQWGGGGPKRQEGAACHNWAVTTLNAVPPGIKHTFIGCQFALRVGSSVMQRLYNTPTLQTLSQPLTTHSTHCGCCGYCKNFACYLVLKAMTMMFTGSHISTSAFLPFICLRGSTPEYRTP